MVLDLAEERGGVPPDRYGIIEEYCFLQGCGCGVIRLRLVGERGGWVATLALELETLPEPDRALRLLDAWPQEDFAPVLRELVAETALADPELAARLERNHQRVRAAVRRRPRPRRIPVCTASRSAPSVRWSAGG